MKQQPTRILFDRSARTYAGDGESEIEVVVRDAETRSKIGTIFADTQEGHVEEYDATLRIDGKVARSEQFDVEDHGSSARAALAAAKAWCRENAGLARDVDLDEAKEAVDRIEKIIATVVGSHVQFAHGGTFSRQAIALASIRSSCSNFWDGVVRTEGGE